MSAHHDRRIRRRTSVTEPPGGSRSTPQQQWFAASLRTDDPNKDVYIKVPSASTPNHNRSRRRHKPSTTGVKSPRNSSDNTMQRVKYEPKNQVLERGQSFGEDYLSESRAALLQRRRALRSGNSQVYRPPVGPPQNGLDISTSGRNTNEIPAVFNSPLVHHHNNDGSSKIHISRRGSIDILSAAQSKVAPDVRTAPPLPPAQQYVPVNLSDTRGRMTVTDLSSPRNQTSHSLQNEIQSRNTSEHDQKNYQVATIASEVRNRTRIFRMENMSARQLLLENLRLQDRISMLEENETHNKVHDTRNTNIDVSNVATMHGVSALASTNADLSRRVQRAIQAEAAALNKVRTLEEENLRQQKRFAELVEISRRQESDRNESEEQWAGTREQLQEAESRVVRLLSRLHIETKNNERLKQLLRDAELRCEELEQGNAAGDEALRSAYVNTQAEVSELRSQVDALRIENARMAKLAEERASQELVHERNIDQLQK